MNGKPQTRLQAFAHRLIPGRFGRAVVTLASGTLAAQLLVYITRPILTRLYTPEAFGLFGFFLALVSIFSAMSSGRYEDALMLPEEEEKGFSLLSLSLHLTALTALFSSLLLPWKEEIAHLFNRPTVAAYMAWVPIGILLTGWARQLEVWLTRKRAFKWVSGAKLSRQVATVPTQLGLGIYHPTADSLIVGALSGYLIHLLVIFRQVKRLARGLFVYAFRYRLMLSLAQRYQNFPRYTLLASLLNTFSLQLPTLLLLYFFSTDTVGHYMLAYSTLTVPITLLGMAIAQVFFVDAAEAYRKGELRNLTDQVIFRLFLLGTFPVLSFTIIGPDVFQFLFGKNWQVSGIFAALMAPWILVLFVTSPMSFIVDIRERQRAALIFTLFLLIARTGVLVLGGHSGSALLAVGAYSAISGGSLMGYLLYLAHLAEVPIRRVFYHLWISTLTALPFLLILLISHWVQGNPIITLSVWLFLLAGYAGVLVKRYALFKI